MKTALISGITGQDGAYLSRALLSKGYQVHGIKRRASMINTSRVDWLYEQYPDRFKLHYGDLTDSLNVFKILEKVAPDEIYNLGAQSHVAVSFEMPEYTTNVDALGTLRFLEAINTSKSKAKFYQASTSELYGKVQEIPQTETTPFYPRSPYAVAKQYAYWILKNYREAYNVFACNGILFNHESPLRGETFVTRKITREVAKIYNGQETTLVLGNLNAKRDWGHAADYVEGMWKMLQQDKADDYVLATNQTTTIRDFVKESFLNIGIELAFEGTGIDEKARCTKSGKIYVEVNERYFRPTEVELLIGDYSKAKKDLGWEPKIFYKELCKEMTLADCYRFSDNNGKRASVEEIIMKNEFFSKKVKQRLRNAA